VYPRNTSRGEEVTMTIRESDMGNSGVTRAIWAGAGVALAGAVAWGLLGAYADIQIWIVAVFVGFGIGWVMTRLVERVTLSLQVAAVVLTLASVVLGQVLIIAFAMQDNFGNFDLGLSWRLYREAVSSGDITGDLLFGLAGGAFGAFYAVRMLRAKASKPTVITDRPQNPST
jgi:hypothetical protein